MLYDPGTRRLTFSALRLDAPAALRRRGHADVAADGLLRQPVSPQRDRGAARGSVRHAPRDRGRDGLDMRLTLMPDLQDRTGAGDAVRRRSASACHGRGCGDGRRACRFARCFGAGDRPCHRPVLLAGGRDRRTRAAGWPSDGCRHAPGCRFRLACRGRGRSRCRPCRCRCRIWRCAPCARGPPIRDACGRAGADGQAAGRAARCRDDGGRGRRAGRSGGHDDGRGGYRRRARCPFSDQRARRRFRMC
jgi:hypothetical protein